MPPRFFLSATACRGILRRAERRGKEGSPAVTTGPPFSRTGNERVECDAIVPAVSSTLSARDNEKPWPDQWVDCSKAVIECQTVGALDTQCGLQQQAHQSLNSGHYVLERDVMGTLTARMFNALGSRR